MIFSDTITVYNIIPQHGREPQRIQHSVLHGVFWDGTYGAAFSKRGKTDSDRVQIMIPHTERILPDYRWTEKGCPADRVTLKSGDYIVRGAFGAVSSAAELDSIAAEKIIVSEVRDCRFGSRFMWHWEVTGK